MCAWHAGLSIAAVSCVPGWCCPVRYIKASIPTLHVHSGEFLGQLLKFGAMGCGCRLKCICLTRVTRHCRNQPRSLYRLDPATSSLAPSVDPGSADKVTSWDKEVSPGFSRKDASNGFLYSRA